MPPRSTPPRHTPATQNLFSQPEPAHPAQPSGWITAHCDGGARGNPGPSGYGALITSADGTVLAELSEYLGLRTNNFAEYSGLLGSLAYALEHNHRRLRVVSDSELMVKQIQGKYQVKSPDLKPLHAEAKRRIAQLEAFEITHALRHKNKDADRLANEAMDRGTSRAMDKGTSVRTSKPAPKPPIPIALPNGPTPPDQPLAPGTMLRGFTRDGLVHILGGSGAKLPNGIFVKIIPE